MLQFFRNLYTTIASWFKSDQKPQPFAIDVNGKPQDVIDWENCNIQNPQETEKKRTENSVIPRKTKTFSFFTNRSQTYSPIHSNYDT